MTLLALLSNVKDFAAGLEKQTVLLNNRKLINKLISSLLPMALSGSNSDPLH
jgi:hypothetical protein